jgi:hypothetical protein
VETVLVCNACRAETTLGGLRVTEQGDAMTFCAAHQTHSEGFGYSLLLAVPRQGTAQTIDSLTSGITLMELRSEQTPTLHAALQDMSSLCGQVPVGQLLRDRERTWGDVRAPERCPACDAFSDWPSQFPRP